MVSDIARRKFLATLLGGAAAPPCTWPFAAFGQASDKPPRRIGYLGGSSPTAAAKNVVAFLEGMRAHGYVEGRDIEMDYRWAEGHLQRLPTLAEELVRSKIDLILAGLVHAAVAASDATKTIPIVCPVLADPVRLGLIKSDARPGGNVTGLLEWVEGLPGKHLELVHDLIPSVTKIGLVVNPDNVHNLAQRRELETAAGTKDIEIVSIEARIPEDVDSIFPTLSRERVDAVIVLRDAMLYGERGRIAASAMAVRLPTVYGFREHVDAGGLISYGISLPESSRRAADYVVKILEGAKPGDLPVEFPTKLELVINLKTARALGLTVPLTLQAAANEVIE
jgi:putative tryptophan/tyrosine transport system substrate-binding protein